MVSYPNFNCPKSLFLMDNVVASLYKASNLSTTHCFVIAMQDHLKRLNLIGKHV